MLEYVHKYVENMCFLDFQSPGVGTESMIPGSIDNMAPSYVPRFLEGQSAVAIQHVACGDLFTACLTDRGILMTYGSGANGCLGHGNLNDVSQVVFDSVLNGVFVDSSRLKDSEN